MTYFLSLSDPHHEPNLMKRRKIKPVSNPLSIIPPFLGTFGRWITYTTTAGHPGRKAKVISEVDSPCGKPFETLSFAEFTKQRVLLGKTSWSLLLPAMLTDLDSGELAVQLSYLRLIRSANPQYFSSYDIARKER
jgi:hypothetical protein